MDLIEIRHRVTRDTSQVSCPGGMGNFGFNSYDLLTFSLLVMGAVSSAVIVNTNKNENNNNNNDFESSFGEINTNNQMASADQTSTNMAIITVPPAGPPVVVPAGRMLFNGTLMFRPETLTSGVSWESRDFRVYDDGVILDKETGKRRKGVTTFGTIDDRNVFHPISSLDWAKIRGNREVKASGQPPPVIPFDGKPVFVPKETLNDLFHQTVLKHGLTLVQIAIPSVGPPIIFPLGTLLNDGSVYLNDGIEVPGIFWESPDRILHDNGTIVYKITNTSEVAKIIIATLDQEGSFDFLPRALHSFGETSLDTLRKVNVKPASQSLEIVLDDLNLDTKSWEKMKRSLEAERPHKRRKRSHSKYFKLRQMLSLINIIDNSQEDSARVFCNVVSKLHDAQTVLAILNHKPSAKCFYDAIISYCISESLV